MAEPLVLTPEQKEELIQRRLQELGLMDSLTLANVRQHCANGTIAAVKSDVESIYGADSFPAVPDYCIAANRTSVEHNDQPMLYINMAIQQLGLGTELSFNEQGEAVAGKTGTLLRNIRGAADGGYTSYMDMANRERPLSCALAFDAGASWGSLNGDKVDRNLSVEQAERIARVCYDPAIAEVNISTTGEKLTVQQAGLRAGEILGREWKLCLEASATLPSTDNIPVPQPAPERPAKQALVIGG